VRGCEGTVAEKGSHTLAFVGWLFLTFFLSAVKIHCSVVFSACIQWLRLKTGGQLTPLRLLKNPMLNIAISYQNGTNCPLVFSLY
jgi:hypothetical protein